MASINPTIVATVAVASTTKLAWDSLHMAYANKSQTQVFSYRDQLARLSKDSRQSLNISMKCPDFREISAAIRARNSIISYEELYAKLIDHELFLKHEELKKETAPITVAMVTHNRTNNSSNHRVRRRTTTHNGVTTIVLMLLLKDVTPITMFVVTYATNKVILQMFAGTQVAPNQWLVDSGATHHVTTERTNLEAVAKLAHRRHQRHRRSERGSRRSDLRRCDRWTAKAAFPPACKPPQKRASSQAFMTAEKARLTQKRCRTYAPKS
uniref:Uncharacterized protein n=1 Tax=Nicotiana tabacum TaxID=4097 RepID=A0A1S3YKW4_TOBAC|nr:PREDICTED: uncharacterized protein LOC107777258 [Nicotiana tabacum]